MAKDRKYIVGVNRRSYPEQRNIFSLRSSEFTVKRVYDIQSILNGIAGKFGRSSRYRYHTFNDLGLNKVDLFHFFNTISLTNKPWITTFENELPRLDVKNKKLVKRLAHDSCKQLIALSKNAADIQKWWMMQEHPELADQINRKITVLHPPQNLSIQAYKEKQLPDTITFTFVGNAFYHKGGLEMLRAFDKLDSDQWRLKIISNFTKVGWFDDHITSDDEAWVKNFIRNNTNISVRSDISQKEVLDELKRSHVALLPSFGETYGYAILEAQSCGTPVITTNSWAMPEINSNECGWLLDLPVKSALGGSRGDFDDINSQIEYGGSMTNALVDRLNEILSNTDVIGIKGENALQRIQTTHDPLVFSSKLEMIYLNAMNADQ